MELTTRYMGLELRNPLVVSASPLTMDLENVRACEAHGAGAVVLRSLYEEQIVNELEGRLDMIPVRPKVLLDTIPVRPRDRLDQQSDWFISLIAA